MDNTALMIKLLSRIKSEMNGAVVESMQLKGISYPLSYGVSSATVRKLAKEYAPNHALAELLYRQQIRELRLAAATIAQPENINSNNLYFWQQGVTNIEIAEHLGAFLLCKTTILKEIIDRWILKTNNENLRYCALIASAKSITQNTDNKIDDAIISSIASHISDTDPTMIVRLFGELICRYASKDDDRWQHVASIIDSMKDSAPSVYKYLCDEISR